MKIATILPVLLLCLGSALHADDAADLAKLRAIPAPKDPVMDTLPTEVIVTSEGVLINDSKVPIAKMLYVLAKLPPSAWTFGRAVVYFPSPPGVSSPKDQPSHTQVEQVQAKLHSAGIEMVPGIST